MREGNSHSVKSHFQGKDPIVETIYKNLLKAVRECGPVIEDPKKTSIHLVNKTALAGIATRKNYLILTLKSDRELKSSRIHASDQVSTHRFHSQIRLSSLEEVDSEVIGWLKAAHAISG